MIYFLALFVILIGLFSVAFSLLSSRLGILFSLVFLGLCGYLWRMPRYYVLDTTAHLGQPAGWGGAVVLNEEATGRSWTYNLPVTFNIDHVGHYLAVLLFMCMLAGAMIGYKFKQERASKLSESS